MVKQERFASLLDQVILKIRSHPMQEEARIIAFQEILCEVVLDNYGRHTGQGKEML